MITGEILRTVLHYVIPGSAAQNVFFHEYTGPGTTDASALATIDAWFTAVWGPDWVQLGSQNAEMDFVECDVINPDGTVARNLGAQALNIAGTNPNSTGGAAISSYLLAYTDQPKQRGSKYVPGISEAMYDNNLFTAGALVDMAALLASYLSIINPGQTNEFTPGVLSRTLEVFVPFIGNGLIDAQPAYQRRRKDGVGI